MVQKISTFYDDFLLPGVDRSKWAAPVVSTGGLLTIHRGLGLNLKPSTTTGLYTYIRSTNGFDLTNNAVFIKVSGATFANNATKAIFRIDRDADSYAADITLYYNGGWKLRANLFNSAGTAVTSGITGATEVAWNANTMRFWRHARNSTGRHYWQYSADAVTWVTLAYVDGWAAMVDVHVKIMAGNGDTGTGFFTVRGLNILTEIDRGSGYVSDTMDGYYIQSIPTYTTTPPTQFGLWQLRTGSASIIQDPDNAAAGQNAMSVSTTSSLLSSTGGTFKDIDVSAKIRLTTSSSVGTLLWRSDQSLATYWFLKVTPSTLSVGYRSGGTDTVVSSVSHSVPVGTFYTYRVIHVGAEVVAYEDTGFGSVGYGRPNIEKIRTSSASVSTAGVMGLLSAGAASLFKDVVLANGVTPPTTVTGTLEPTQFKPWSGSRSATVSNLEYLYLSDTFGNTLNLLPSYGDIVLKSADFGTPTSRQIVRDRPLGNGSVSETRFHGSKAVALTVSAYKVNTAAGTLYQEAQYYSDLIQRWTRPGFKCKLIYKPRGDLERYINVEGTNLGRSVTTAISNQRIDLDMGFLAVDGGDYETAEQAQDIPISTTTYVNSTGSLSTEPTIRIYGPCTNPTIINQTVEAYDSSVLARLGLTVVLSSGEFVEFDLKERDVRYMGWTDKAASYRQYLTTARWFTQDPGRTAYYLTSDDLGGAARVIWHDKF